MRLIAFLLTTAVAFAGCKTPSVSSSQVRDENQSDLLTPASSGACVALRGNGRKIYAHFASVARIVEETGLVKAMAGGSSSTITMFLYESIIANPNLTTCGDRECTRDEVKVRVALMMKSLVGYFDVVASSTEVIAAMQLQDFVARVRASGVAAAIASADEDEAAAMRQLLASEEFRRLYGSVINQEVVDLLDRSPNPQWHARDIYGSVVGENLFDASNQLIFLRPFLIDWDAVTEVFGRIGDLYASRGADTQASQAAMFRACTPGSLEKSWSEIAYPGFAFDNIEASLAAPGRCQDAFKAWVNDYFTKVRGQDGEYTSRLLDPIGKYVNVFPATGIIADRADMAKLVDARSRYLRAELPEDWASNPDAWFELDFSKVKLGYWGDDAELNRAGNQIQQLGEAADPKSQRFFSLGSTAWYEVLSASPAEPSISSYVPIDRLGVISVGGWSDLQPTLLLEHLGCGTSVFVTRVGDRSTFAQDVMFRLGAKAGEIDDLLSMDYERRPLGAHAQSIIDADVTWCTNWAGEEFTSDRIGTHKLAHHSFHAPAEVRQSNFAPNYVRRQGKLNLAGCTPGVPMTQ